MGRTAMGGSEEPAEHTSTGCLKAEDEEAGMAGPEDLGLGPYQRQLKFR
jgi:hypothetical protein